ncbi:hypothetical protein B0H17DRAFT_1088218 [Mycena rosella]|uniref:F-box domain-containing protein n=1 Tax=Mycena rosella TaxID=1033263 RepID=A0AAD7G5E2_MYCRO|nr:hypothetical protein B0H17DRAFT_1088218 [Mycena rosella]
MHSPFAHLLHTNHVPSESEIHQIEAFLLDDETTRLWALIDDLADRRKVVAEIVDTHRALLSPFRRLPNDIVQEIFVACLPTEHNATMSAAQAPLLLGRVCRSWRTFAHSVPLLWSTLHIPIGMTYGRGAVREMPPRLFPGLHSAVDIWLDRSRACPLSLSVTSYPDVSAVSAPFLEHLMAWSRRWKSLKLKGGRSLDDFLAVPRIQEQFPILENLVIHHSAETPREAARWDLLRAPGLRNVTLTVKITNPLELPPPWEQLVYLDLECEAPWPWGANVGGSGLSVDAAVQLLQKCHRLEVCSLHVSQQLGAIFASSTTAQLTFLRSLWLFQTHCARHLLDRLMMPNLRDFGLRRHARIQGIATQGLFNPIANDPPSLEILDMFLNALTDDSLTDTLRLFPSLFELRLTGFYVPGDLDSQQLPLEGAVLDDTILGLLTPDPSSPDYLCPVLDFVVFRTMSTLSDNALLKFIERRAASAHPLKSVYVQFSRPMEWDILLSLEPYISAGLDVEIRYVIPEYDGARYSPTI